MLYVVSSQNLEHPCEMVQIDIQTHPEVSTETGCATIGGWCGTRYNIYVYGHGAFPTLEAAREFVEGEWSGPEEVEPKNDPDSTTEKVASYLQHMIVEGAIVTYDRHADDFIGQFKDIPREQFVVREDEKVHIISVTEDVAKNLQWIFKNQQLFCDGSLLPTKFKELRDKIYQSKWQVYYAVGGLFRSVQVVDIPGICFYILAKDPF